MLWICYYVPVNKDPNPCYLSQDRLLRKPEVPQAISTFSRRRSRKWSNDNPHHALHQTSQKSLRFRFTKFSGQTAIWPIVRRIDIAIRTGNTTSAVLSDWQCVLCSSSVGEPGAAFETFLEPSSAPCRCDKNRATTVLRILVGASVHPLP
jgi:hypothetical protein